jgi:methylenetetrahydrofolate dehydrogenase (NADP+)/methenyltetrahydrofolate cyclohydrolase
MILDGKKVSIELKNRIKKEIETKNIKPTLAIIQVGDNSASNIYIRNKKKACEYCGITSFYFPFREDACESEVLAKIEELNHDSNINGIIVQLPLPSQMNEEKIINAVDNSKDVDGFGLINKGRLLVGEECFEPATPKGILELLDNYQIDLTGKHVVVMGRSNIVGKPVAILCLQRNATVTICHSRTKNIKEITKTADILIVAIGKAKMVDATYIKEGAVVIDVGMNRDNGFLCGDVDYESVSPLASYITPVPGGCGPMTIAELLENTIRAYKIQKQGENR